MPEITAVQLARLVTLRNKLSEFPDFRSLVMTFDGILDEIEAVEEKEEISSWPKRIISV